MLGSERCLHADLNLHARALALHTLTGLANVMPGTLAARDLERARAELEETIATIERTAGPPCAIADRLKGIAITLECALYMGGINAAGAPPLIEIQSQLSAWFEE